MMDKKYLKAMEIMKNAASKKDYVKAAKLFSEIIQYKDSNIHYEFCKNKIGEISINTKEGSGKKKFYISAIIIVWTLAIILGIYIFAKSNADNKSGESGDEPEDKFTAVEVDSPGNGNMVDENEPDDDEKDEDTAEVREYANVNDIIAFGSYEQDGYVSNGNEELEWIVLDETDDMIFVVSKYGVDAKPYNEYDESVTWEDCTLREWLNEDFMDYAFSDREIESIRTVTVTADKNPGYSTYPGNNTEDKIFILSINEVSRYFNSDEAMLCLPTSEAVYRGVSENSDGNCCWWLRQPGYAQNAAATVYSYGGVNGFGNFVYNEDVGVRPAMWIDIDAEYDIIENE